MESLVINQGLVSDPNSCGQDSREHGQDKYYGISSTETHMHVHAHTPPKPWKSPKCPSNSRLANKLQPTDRGRRYTQYVATEKTQVIIYDPIWIVE